MRLTWILLCLSLLAVPVLAQDLTPTPEPETPAVAAEEVTGDDIGEAVKDVGAAIKAFKDKRWATFWGMILSVIIVVIRFFFGKLPKRAWPWVACLLGMMGYVSAGLNAGLPPGEVVWTGLFTGAVAITFWQMALKHAVKFVKKWWDARFAKGPEDEPTPVNP